MPETGFYYCEVTKIYFCVGVETNGEPHQIKTGKVSVHCNLRWKHLLKSTSQKNVLLLQHQKTHVAFTSSATSRQSI
jgi:hypothetical protein